MVACIEMLNQNELENLIGSFGSAEMMNLIAEVDKELKETTDYTEVKDWTPDEEWAAKQDELDRFDDYNVWTLTVRDPKGPRALSWVWVIEMRSGELKARLCLRDPSGRRW